MKLFNRKKKTAQNSEKIPGKKLDAFNYTPVRYNYTDSFKNIIDSKESFAKRKIDQIPINELSDDICDPEVDALCKVEEAYSIGECVVHLRVIKEIKDSCSSEVRRTSDIMDILMKESDEHEEELNELLRIRKLNSVV